MRTVLVINPNSSAQVTAGLEAAVLPRARLRLCYFTGPAQSPAIICSIETCAQSAEACVPALAPLLRCYDGFLVACFADHPLVQLLRGSTSKPVTGLFPAGLTRAVEDVQRKGDGVQGDGVHGVQSTDGHRDAEGEEMSEESTESTEGSKEPRTERSVSSALPDTPGYAPLGHLMGGHFATGSASATDTGSRSDSRGFAILTTESALNDTYEPFIRAMGGSGPALFRGTFSTGLGGLQIAAGGHAVDEAIARTARRAADAGASVLLLGGVVLTARRAVIEEAVPHIRVVDPVAAGLDWLEAHWPDT